MENTTEKKRTTKPKIVQKCFICSQHFEEQYLDRHMHSYDHHMAITQQKGSKWVHKCWACDICVTGLEQYKMHIATCEHRENLLKLQWKRHQKVKLSVDYTADHNVKPNTLHTQGVKKKSLQKCFVCCHSFNVQDLNKHMHSFAHHQAIEKLKGSKQVHKCWACDTSVRGLQEYYKHVSTGHHKYMMCILNERTDNEKSTVDYSVELEACCAQRDQQMCLNKKKRLRNKAKKAVAKQKAQEKKVIQNCQARNESQSVCLPIPDIADEDFTSDDLTMSCNLFSSWEEQQNTSTCRLNQTLLIQTRESLFDRDHLNWPLVKRPCLPLEVPAREMSCPTFDGEVAGVGRNGPISKDKLGASTCAPEPVQKDYNHISLFGTIYNSLDNKDVTVGAQVNVKSHTKEVNEHTCKSNHEKGLKKSRKKPVKEKNQRQEASFDSFSTVTSLDEMIRTLRYQTSATRNEDACQIIEICENESFRTNTDTDRERITECYTEQAETSLPNDFQTVSCNVQKPEMKKQDISDITHWNPETTSKHKNVNELMTVSSREENLTDSLRNVGDQLFQAYANLKNAYAEVQHLLEVKQQVTSEMATLRAERIQILQDLRNPS